MGFRFSLDTVLDVQKHKETIAHKELLEAHLVLERLGNELKELQESLAAVENDTRTSAQTGMRIDYLQDYQRYTKMLQAKVSKQIVRIEEASASFERKRLVVVEQMQRRKILEQLKTQHQEVWVEEQAHAEAVFLDDVTTSRYRFTGLGHTRLT